MANRNITYIPQRLKSAAINDPFIANAEDIEDIYNKEQVNNIISRTPETDVFVVDVPAGEDIAEWLDDNIPNVQIPVTEIIKTVVQSTVVEGSFPYYARNGEWVDNANMNSWVFAGILPSGNYSAEGFGVPSAAYTNAAYVHYYSNDTWLGYNESIFSERGPSRYTETSIPVPDGCNKIVVVSYKGYAPTMFKNTEVEIPGKYISSRANKLYRVPGPDNTTYSEWAWDGEKFIMLANKNYGIDDVPTAGSDNTVKSGGVYSLKGNLFAIHGTLKANGTVVNTTTATLYCTDFLPIDSDDIVFDGFQNTESSDIYPLCFYTKDKEFISAYTFQEQYSQHATILKDNIPQDAFFIRVCGNVPVSASITKGVSFNSIIGYANSVFESTNRVVYSDNPKINSIVSGLYAPNVQNINSVTVFLYNNYLSDGKYWNGITIRESDNTNHAIIAKTSSENTDVIKSIIAEEGAVSYESSDIPSGTAVSFRCNLTVYINNADVFSWKNITLNESDFSNNAFFNSLVSQLYIRDIQTLKGVTCFLYNNYQQGGLYWNGILVREPNEGSYISHDLYTKTSKRQAGNCRCAILENGGVYYNPTPIPDGTAISFTIDLTDRIKDITWSPSINVETEKTVVFSHDVALREETKTQITSPTIDAGHFYRYDTLEYVDTPYMTTYFYADINPENTYSVIGFGLPSASYTNTACVFYFEDDTCLGYDRNSFIERGPYVRNKDLYLNVPGNCNKIAVCTQNGYVPTLYNITFGDLISSQELKDEIGKGSGGEKKMKVTINGNDIYVRTAIDNETDIIINFSQSENGNMTPVATYLGAHGASDDDIFGNPIHSWSDSTSPLRNVPQYWNLYAQHGIPLPLAVIDNNPLTPDDIGSWWADQSNRQYQIGRISGRSVYLIPRVTQTSTPGIVVRDWKDFVHDSYPTSLTHVGGAVHTDTLTIASCSQIQLRPIQTPTNRKFVCDGVEVGNGIYQCSQFVISETLACIDATRITQYFPSIVSDQIAAYITNSFIFKGTSIGFNQIFDCKNPIQFGSYGANQAQHLRDVNGLECYVMVPKVKKNNTNGAIMSKLFRSRVSDGNVYVHRTAADLYDINKSPDRQISILKTSGGVPVIGFASGLSLVRGITRDEVRNTYIANSNDSEGEALLFSPVNYNKFYVSAISAANTDRFTNNLMQPDFCNEFSTYFTYFKPTDDIQAYWYNDGDATVIYAHAESNTGRTYIDVSDLTCEGKSLEVVEKTDNANLATDTIVNGKVCVSFTSNDANYIVLKTV